MTKDNNRSFLSCPDAQISWFAMILGVILSLCAGNVSNCVAYDLAVEGDLLINGLAASPAVDGTGVDPSLNPPINWAFSWGDFTNTGAVSIPGNGPGLGTDIQLNVVDYFGGAGAGGGGLDGALVFSMTDPGNALQFNASTHEMAVKLTVHSDHANVLDNNGVPGTQSIFRFFFKDYDHGDLQGRAQEDLIYDYDITNIARNQMVEIAVPLNTPTAIYHDAANPAGDSLANFDADDPLGAGTGGAFELQIPAPWGSHGRYHITIHEMAIRLRTATENPGDFDSDGDVDGRDFLVWQRGLSPTPLSSSDLSDWQINYGPGTVQALATSVPEPCSSLLLMAIVGLSTMTRRH
jgi:hypothetical protein